MLELSLGLWRSRGILWGTLVVAHFPEPTSEDYTATKDYVIKRCFSFLVVGLLAILFSELQRATMQRQRETDSRWKSWES
jgi:hypothetical protein